MKEIKIVLRYNRERGYLLTNKGYAIKTNKNGYLITDENSDKLEDHELEEPKEGEIRVNKPQKYTVGSNLSHQERYYKMLADEKKLEKNTTEEEDLASQFRTKAEKARTLWVKEKDASRGCTKEEILSFDEDHVKRVAVADYKEKKRQLEEESKQWDRNHFVDCLMKEKKNKPWWKL